MYIHGAYYNEQGDRIAVYLVTGGDRTEELEIGDGRSGLWWGEDPVETESQVNDTFDVLLKTQATIRLLTANYVEELFASTCRDAVVNIYRGEECVFAGFVEPMTLSQGYNEELDEVELTCVDCLCALQYGRYRQVGSAGVSYQGLKAAADQRTLGALLREVTGEVTRGLDLVRGEQPRIWYDGSKSTDSETANRWAIFDQLAVNELLLMGDEEDDVWGQDEVLEEVLKWMNLHMVQEGLAFYIFSWETVKGDEAIEWRELTTGAELTTERQTVAVTTGLTVDTETTISVGETYNQLALTCRRENMDTLVESPLDDDLLRSPFANKQKYMTEYSADGEGVKALNAFDEMVHGGDVTYEDGCVTDWYVQVMKNERWRFPDRGEGDLMEKYATGGKHQERLPNIFPTQPAAAIVALGKVEKKTDGKDNSPTAKVEMTNYLVVSVNGNGKDTEAEAYPNEASLKDGVPCAVYEGATSGGVLSPADEETTNYIVLSGKVILNPLTELTGGFWDIWLYRHDPYYEGGSSGGGGGGGRLVTNSISYWKGKTVASRKNDDGRYYTRRWWGAATPTQEAQWQPSQEAGLDPFTETGPEEYEFNYSAVGDGSDHVSKVAVLACMLIIGDKCVVESGTEGRVADYEWRRYKPLEECADEDEYYGQCFTIGFDPKIGDKLVGVAHGLQNNISLEMGLDVEGTAIAVRKSDGVSGRVQLKILGPVNTLWDEVTRRHKTWFRHTKWGSRSVPLLAHVSDILVEKLEVKVYSDNGLVNNTGDSDLVYVSDTQETYVNRKDDLEMRINSALTAEERQALDVTEAVSLSTPVNVMTGEAVTTLYDHGRGESGKAEQQYVDSYWREWHAPRVEMTQRLRDKAGEGVVGLWTHYRNGAMKNRAFYVEGVSRNLTEGWAEMTLKEIEQ